MASSTPPKPQVKFGVRTNSGRVMSLPRDEDVTLPHVSEFTSTSSGGPLDYLDYMVTMPPTPDNQPIGADVPAATQTRLGNHKPTSRLANKGRENAPERSLSVMRSTNKSTLIRSQTSEFDHNRWLFDSHGTYGYGNAYQQADGGTGKYDETGLSDFLNKPWKPLTRKIKVPNGILSPYRVLVWIRLAVLVLFLVWRVRNPNQDAMWLWGMSIVCEIWFAFSWLLDQLPKLNPVNREADLSALHEKFETPSPENPYGRSDLPGLDVFISTADPEKEPPLVTANTLLSILAAEYPVEKLSVYISDDGAALLTFEAMAEAVAFAEVWVPFCRKHSIEPRNPEAYFSIRKDATKNKKNPEFVKDRRWIKREYDEFKATWMADCTHWPGTWLTPAPDHSKSDHASILQVMIKTPHPDPVYGVPDEHPYISFTDVDIRLPMFVYVSREKRKGYDHNKKAGAMNALVRASAILSNGPFILNFDCDHYIYNSFAIREGNMRALDGLQGPMYVGTGCLFRRFALYGFNPPRANEYTGLYGQHKRTISTSSTGSLRFTMEDVEQPLAETPDIDAPMKFGNSRMFVESIRVAEFQGRPLADHPSVKNGRPPGALLRPRSPLDAPTVAEAVTVISCWYEDNTEWGDRVGWIYGSVTEDVVTGISLEELWRNEQFWVIGGTSAHLVAVLQGLLKVIAGIEISFTLTSKSAAEDEEDIYADLYVIKYTSLFIPPLIIITLNITSIFVGCSRTIYSEIPQWSKLLGGGFFSFWVLVHMYPFAKGLMGRRGRTPTIIYVWCGLLAITISLLWITISPPEGSTDGSASITV
ncbi:Cellulose synthase-like protein [Rhynchospora pubera]|uniref:Cellulose synthase-like protein n=1 Tax=Rhynchospora pubera TaxID=906938 RepID=A0AAV8FCW8_9POAL|nr:Cellulose synthase-like protein [Rhynchospora pubera]